MKPNTNRSKDPNWERGSLSVETKWFNMAGHGHSNFRPSQSLKSSGAGT